MTGLPWAATIPLVAFSVKIVILTPIELYSWRLGRKQWQIHRQMEESRMAIEKKIEQQHRHKSPSDLRIIQNMALGYTWRQTIKQNGAQSWRTFTNLVRFPIWFTMMETIRRMTGVEDGMPSLAAKSLTTLKGRQYTEPGTMDQLIPMEPSLATEGMLWIGDLMIPDPSLILPFALSGIIFVMSKSRRGTIGLYPGPGSSSEEASKILSWNRWKNRCLGLASVVIGPATLMFPSAMLLYWISSSLAAIIVSHVVKFLLSIRIIRVTKVPGKDKPGEDKPKSKPKMQEYRGPTMKDLRNQKKIK